MLSLNGDINTGILIRTVHLRDGIARYSAGATLLYDSVPELEERRNAPEGHRIFPRLARPRQSKRPRPTKPAARGGA